jgi:hypothetical protein
MRQISLIVISLCWLIPGQILAWPTNDRVVEKLTNLSHAKIEKLMKYVKLEPPEGFYNCLCRQIPHPDNVGVSYHPGPTGTSPSCSKPGLPCVYAGYGCTRRAFPADKKAWDICLKSHRYKDGTTFVDAIIAAGAESLLTEKQKTREKKSEADVIGGFSEVDGRVMILRHADWDPEDEDCWDKAEMATLQTPIHYGDHIRTWDGSKAVFSTYNGTHAVEIGQDTHFMIYLKPRESSKLRLIWGNIVVNVKKMLKDGSMDIEMNQIAAGAKGTKFRCMETDDLSQVEVYEGIVEVTYKPTGEKRLFNAGQGVKATPNGMAFFNLNDSDGTASETENVYQQGLQANREKKDPQAVELFTSALQNGKLTGKKPVDAYYQRGGASISLDDYTLWITPDWKKYSWTKNGRHRGWRLRYQPGGIPGKASGLHISLAAEPTIGGTIDEIFATQDRMLNMVKAKYPDGFLARNMPLAGGRAIILRYYNKGNTVFIAFPHIGNRLYDLYVWVKGKVDTLPAEANELLSTLTLPGQIPFQPAATAEKAMFEPITGSANESVSSALQDSAAAPVPGLSESPPDAGQSLPSSTEINSMASQVAGVCYLAEKAASGEILDLRLGMPIAEVEKRYRVFSYSSGAYRLYKAPNPCLANYEYELAKQGFEQKPTSHAVTFEVNKKESARPLSSIVAKIICEPGIEVSRRLFDWYAQTYGPAAKKTNEIDGTMKLGSRVISNEFWHTWHLQSPDGKPVSLEIKRRNDYAYYTITLEAL